MAIDKIYFYLTWLLLGAGLAITTGLYLFNIFIILFLLYRLVSDRLVLGKNNRSFILSFVGLIAIPQLLSLLYQVLQYSFFTSYSVYIVINLTILTSYIFFFNNIRLDLNKINHYFILFIFSAPIIISVIMYFIPSIGVFFDMSQHPGRFGGVWGKDVNQLGYYATLVIIFSCFLLYYKKIKLFFAVSFILLSLFAILISGMRTGLFLLVLLLPVMTVVYKDPLINLNQLFKFCLILVGVGLIVYFLDYSLFSIVIERFDVYRLISDISGASNNGQIGNMYSKWLTSFAANSNLLDILFSFNYEWKFPDSLIIFYLANGGLLGAFFLLIFIKIVFLLIKNNNFNYILVFIALFSILVSIKGNFIFNNIGMFIFAYMIHSYDKFNNEEV
jgi:hypothetical protein